MGAPPANAAAPDADPGWPLAGSLRGRRGLAARALWVALAMLATAHFFAGLAGGQEQGALARAGLAGLPDAFFVVLELIKFVGCAAVALLIVWRRPDDAVALFTAITLMAIGATIPSAAEALAMAAGAPVPVDFAGPIGSAALIICFYVLFPDGRPVPRLAWLLPALWLLWGLAALLLPGAPLDPRSWPPLRQFALTMLSIGAALATQLYRYMRVATTVQRQQTRWVVWGAVVTYGAALAYVALPRLFPALGDPARALPLYALAGGGARLLLMLSLPASMGVAVLRSGLWELDPVVGRTLLYAGLTLAVGALYLLLVAGLGLLLRPLADPLIAFMAAGVVAALFHPLRERLQRSVTRLLYGERDDPYAALARLGERLEAAIVPESAMQSLADTVRDAMRLPYAAVALREGEALEVVAASGAASDDAISVELTHQGEAVGRLLLAPRAGDAGFTLADRRLIAALARQAGAAAHALRLHRRLQRATADLRRSRERLVLAREEERRRLRRDLHDEVGPTVASLIQRIDQVRATARRDPAAADALLGEMKSLVRSTVADIRRLAYELRPPALDQYGLVAALRQRAETLGEGCAVSFDAPAEPLALPAAVELAAYRIAAEALANAARHGRARTCCVALALAGDALLLEVVDDGVGAPEGYRAGVGITAMGERAEELGGELGVEAGAEGGTRVWARLPLR
jgi:signal transduction histidine kinase